MRAISIVSVVSSGLTEVKALELLRVNGRNELPQSKKRSLFVLIVSSLREPMILLLISCASIYLLLGKASDSILLFLSVIGVVGISLYQEYRSSRALEALRDLSSPRALVVRDGKEKRIAGADVVPGDILIVKEGDRVAADCILLESAHVQADESLLTGEAEPVEKSTTLKENGADKIFASTLITRGIGTAQVLTTGSKTEVGKIGKALNIFLPERTQLQIEIGKLVRIFTVIGILVSVAVILSYGLTRGDWPQGFLAGIAAAMSLMPEEFPVIMTIFLALGAWRLSKRNVLVRQTAATENLGAITILCVDKTGTLTMNQMSVAECRTPESTFHFDDKSSNVFPENFHPLIEYGVLASHLDPFDPMEKAIRRTLDQKLVGTEHVHDDWILEREYPLSPELLAMSCVWRSKSTPGFRIATKGAPEAIITLCRLPASQVQVISDQISAMSKQGLRVLAVAKAEFPAPPLPAIQHDFDFSFLGLIGLKDPVRSEVPAAIADCYSAGIRVLMITGDYPGTATKIASDIGLHSAEVVLTGSEIEQMTDADLMLRLKTTSVFARMIPNQKLRIIKALKLNEEVVAMTGDGVNDAPSLKWADVGIAMGGRGTDVAREASDIVLLDDCFTSIVTAVSSGRKIFENIKSAMSYIFAVHVPIAGMAIVPILFGLPVALFPAHIVFLELIIDPACTLIFESDPADVKTMKRPPRKLGVRLFSWLEIMKSVIQGVIIFIAIFGVFFLGHKYGYSPERNRTITFCTFIFANLGLIAINRPHILQLRNRAFIWVSSLAVLALLIVIYVPHLRPLFGFAEINLADWSIAIVSSLVATLVGLLIRVGSIHGRLFEGHKERVQSGTFPKIILKP